MADMTRRSLLWTSGFALAAAGSGVAAPGETRNVAAANAGVVERLRGYMQTARVDNPEYPIHTPPKQNRRNKEKRKQLAVGAGR